MAKTKQKSVDDLFNELLHVEKASAPPKVSNPNMADVVESAWQKGETVTVLKRFKSEGVVYEEGSQFKPKYKSHIPKLLKLMNGPTKYFAPSDIVGASEVYKKVKELKALVKHKYSRLQQERIALEKAKQEVQAAEAAVNGAKAEQKRAQGQIKLISNELVTEIEGMPLKDLLGEIK